MTEADLLRLAQSIGDGRATEEEKAEFLQALGAEMASISEFVGRIKNHG